MLTPCIWLLLLLTITQYGQTIERSDFRLRPENEEEDRLKKSTYATVGGEAREPTREELLRNGYSRPTCTVIVERIVCQQLTAKVYLRPTVK